MFAAIETATIPVFALVLGVVFLIEWGVFTALLLALSRIADVTIPERRTLAWQTATITGAALALGFVPVVGPWLGLVAYIVLMRRWFDAGWWGVFIIAAAAVFLARVVAISVAAATMG